MNKTPETDEAWDSVSRTPNGSYDSQTPISNYAFTMAEHSRKMEKQRNDLLASLDAVLTAWEDGYKPNEAERDYKSAYQSIANVRNK